MMPRVRKPDLGIQGNFYPMSTMIQLQDSAVRLTLHCDTPAAVSSLQSGEVEVILDRVTMKDDNLGLAQVRAPHGAARACGIVLRCYVCFCLVRLCPSPPPYARLVCPVCPVCQYTFGL